MNIDTHNKTVPSPLSRASEIKKKTKIFIPSKSTKFNNKLSTCKIAINIT